MSNRFLLSTLLVAVAVICRVAPHPWNFAPVGAIALFAGATYERRVIGLTSTFVAMFISDVLLGYGWHDTLPVIYAAYGLITVLGMFIRDRRDSPLAIGASATAGATIFYVVSNFAVWLTGELYPMTAAGLAECFTRAIPYFGNTLASDLIFSALLFGTYALIERRAAFARIRR